MTVGIHTALTQGRTCMDCDQPINDTHCVLLQAGKMVNGRREATIVLHKHCANGLGEELERL